MKRIWLIIVVLIVLIGGFLIYSSSRQKKVLTNDIFSDKGFTITQDGKTISAQYITDLDNLDMGLAIYPRAEILKSKDAAEILNLGKVKLQLATYLTNDSTDKVEKFYKNQIGSDALRAEGVDGSKRYVVIKSKTNIGSYVNIWREGEKTYFTLIKPLN